jgi:Protein of unknown function (DUF3050)
MISKVQNAIAPFQQQLIAHPLYAEIKHPQHLRTFMEHHVYAVWDFMSLLKALQQGLTATTLPWKPVGNPQTRYLINEIVLAEETDINLNGERMSHYEMYIDAMKKAGADTKMVEHFLSSCTSIAAMENAIQNSTLPNTVKKFLHFTFETIASGKLHCIAAAFTFGREDLIPQMFTAIIAKVQEQFPKEDLTEFKYYFDRHIELDGDEHGPMALKMVAQLCDTEEKWEEAIETSVKALQIRKQLWDGILEEITLPTLA